VSLAALIGAIAGAALGYLNASIVSRAVITALEATDRSTNETERADYRARIRMFWLIVHVVFIGGGMVAGVAMARWLFS
jgi:hypothetical protein